jgi:predicted aminopeptidase
LNTIINEPDSELAETIFHELAHRRLFVPGDTDFNEAFATAVASEGVRRWFLAASTPLAYDRYRAGLAQDHQFVDLIMAARAQLQALYDNPKLSDTAKLSAKSPFDQWFAEPINNAKLNTISAYYDLVPAFDALLRANGGDLEQFYQAVARLAKLPVPERHRQLESYLAPAQQHP